MERTWCFPAGIRKEFCAQRRGQRNCGEYGARCTRELWEPRPKSSGGAWFCFLTSEDSERTTAFNAEIVCLTEAANGFAHAHGEGSDSLKAFDAVSESCPALCLRISARSRSALPRIPVSGLLSSWRKISPKFSSCVTSVRGPARPDSRDFRPRRREACKRFSTHAAAAGKCDSSALRKSAAPAAIRAARLAGACSLPRMTTGANPASVVTTSARGVRWELSESESGGNEDSCRTMTSGERSATVWRAAAKLATDATWQEGSLRSRAIRTAEQGLRRD